MSERPPHPDDCRDALRRLGKRRATQELERRAWTIDLGAIARMSVEAGVSVVEIAKLAGGVARDTVYAAMRTTRALAAAEETGSMDAQARFCNERLAALTAGGPDAQRDATHADTSPAALTAAEHATIACVLSEFADILDEGSTDPESDGKAIAELRRLRTKAASIAFAAVSQ